MMRIGKEKVKKLGLDTVVSFKKEDCMAMSFEDNTFDAVTAAFGIRNFQDLDKGLKEMCRVLKKGGHLEASPSSRPQSVPHEATVPHLFAHVPAGLRQAHQQGQQCLQLSHSDHRGFSARREDDGDLKESRILQSEFQKTDLRNMHVIFC